MLSVTSQEAQEFRMRRHNLLERAQADELVNTVGNVCGVQAQVMSAAYLAVGTRIDGITASDVQRAVRQGQLVRTWAMRGTLHLLATDDLPVFTSALGETMARDALQWMGRHGLAEKDAWSMCDAVVESLSCGEMTRKELAQHAASRFGSDAAQWIDHSWGGVVKLAVFRGDVCFGPNRGRETTYMLAPEPARRSPRPAAEDAGCELLRRYLRAFAPAAPKDFRVWSGLRAPQVQRLWDRLQPELTQVRLDGETLWALTSDTDAFANTRPNPDHVCLLPNFDCFMLGHANKEHLVSQEHYKKVYRTAGWIAPTVLAGGRVAGTWSRTAHCAISIELFSGLSDTASHNLAYETSRLRKFMTE